MGKKIKVKMDMDLLSPHNNWVDVELEEHEYNHLMDLHGKAKEMTKKKNDYNNKINEEGGLLIAKTVISGGTYPWEVAVTDFYNEIRENKAWKKYKDYHYELALRPFRKK